ncbi:DapH/DapD/GlmU-related protein [Zobellia roscoffensis]|uniref:acyltransferase n=1 Tax=Zobellia roscoffensis TaxID=2779508 RepID=UPI001D0540DC|nr:DapH/DapD/GlmU-related protein [Zobellia roscoffensis]
MEEDKIIFKIGGRKRPGFGSIKRKLLYLNKVPVVREIQFLRKWILKTYEIPLSTTINKDFYCSAPNLNLGTHVGLADTFILAYAPVSIGKNCSFSFRNMIMTSSHDLNNFSTVIAKPVFIGDNVWITSNVTILGGVTIGSNTIIGTGSVVTRDIPAGVFAAGNPCKVIKQIDFKK